METLVYLTYHPAALLHRRDRDRGFAASLEQAIREDLARVASRKGFIAPEPGGVEAGALFVDTEYAGYELLSVGLSDGKRAQAWSGPGWEATLKQATLIGGHNVPGDLDRLLLAGFPVPPECLDGTEVLDSLLLARMANENRPSYELEDLTASLFPVRAWKTPTRGKDVREWTLQEREERCRLDAWASYLVAKHETLSVPTELYRFTSRAAMTLWRMHLAGAFVDLHGYARVKDRTETELRRIQDRLAKAARRAGLEDFSPSNDHHIRELLFDKLGLPVLERTEKTKQPQVSRRVLFSLAGTTEGFAKEVSEALIEFSIVDKLHSTYVVGLEPLIQPVGYLPDGTAAGYLPFNFNPLGARTGRRTTNNPNSQNWPKGARRLIRSRWPGGHIVAADYCVAPDTRVLTTDLRWVPAGQLQPGDTLVGFPEDFRTSQGCTKQAVVKRATRGYLPCYRVNTTQGSMVASADHGWVVRKSHRSHWCPTKDLKVGDQVGFWVAPWEEDITREGAYLQGFLDGEGWISGGAVGFGQRAGKTLERICSMLAHRYFPTTRRRYPRDMIYALTSGPRSALRVIGSLRPERLLERSRPLWEGRKLWSRLTPQAYVTSVEYLGPQEVAAFETDTKTFIAEGFLAHNSRLEPCLLAWLAGDEELLGLFMRGNGYLDIARDLLKREVIEGTLLYRAVKSIVLAVHYDIQTDHMAEDLWHGDMALSTDWDSHWELTDQVRLAYLSRFPKLGRYMEARREELASLGYVTTQTGRRRRLTGGEHARRQAINFPVQSYASDVTASALVDTEQAFLAEYGLDVVTWHRLLLEQCKKFLTEPLAHGIMGVARLEYEIPVLFNEVHDEIVTDAPPGHEERARDILVETMRALPSLRRLVPGFDLIPNVSAVILDRWGGGK